MKRRACIITLMLVFGTLFCNAQQSFFDRYVEWRDVKTVYISKRMLKMVKSYDGEVKVNGMRLGIMNEGLENIQIFSCKEKTVIEKMREDVSGLIPSTGYEEVISIRDEGEKVSILFRELKTNLSEFVLITDRSNEFNIISIVGKITLQDIQGMVNEESKEQK
ncbi:MAG: DUF4252 domain-containing protein [Bacteroidaceae bacterium]|nr:DUF4252 domain-containing protein [Bacteroidaceae bacterium]MBR5148624.1 DUF4252 domain-containing protein [Bacteroidaceae bacterium]